MKRAKNLKKKNLDQAILTNIFQLKKEWTNLEAIMERSIDPTNSGLYELAVKKAKYFYLIREARKRDLSATKIK
ncbi:hypothetical protein J416_00195 [Gracilibacillus halophilus YIM-C55.5]|uniref:DUF2508 family protein n=1 Tax=Gracilibacillus halophilus YIM-C55.5 TaxID=1308866 RepID=N4WQS7_9BACI|nr:YaaL family protein [Gracilibacillus halophilus]ENH98477.1 hypothetical protein J416_00195 [Gracilibacillus halophilus YIM-C55.5]